jgi:YidC/Oxa1 family membrane protein insertase
MDRRMLLAMVLAILVLVLNGVLFGPKRGQTPPRTQTTEQPSSATSTESPAAAPGARQVLSHQGSTEPASSSGLESVHDPIADAETSGIIHVSTKTVDAEFDPIGGTLRSWKLRKYTDASGRLADLIRTAKVGAPWFALKDENREIRTDSTRFRATVTESEGGTAVRFLAESPTGVSVEKTYTVPKDGYLCTLTIAVRGVDASNDGAGWDIGWTDGLPIVEKDVRSDKAAISSVALFGKEYVRTHAAGGPFGCAGRSSGTKDEPHSGMLNWFGVRNRYFVGALILRQPTERTVKTSWDGESATAGALMFEPLSASGVTEQTYRLYLGPIHYGDLEKLNAGLERVQDLGPSLFRPFSKLLMKFFIALNKLVPNYGLEILILSILIRLLFYPLSKKSMQSMKRMQQLKPEMDRINEKFKNDPERKNREVLELYKKNKINPLGGCLPVVVQLPVLSGLYFVLANAVQLRKEPFGLWIHDLSAPDTVAHLAGLPLNPLPLVMAGTMFWQQKITPTDPRQASLGYIMPIFMTFLFYSTPSGLVLYWTVSNLMTVLQQIWMNRSGTPEPILAVSEESSLKKDR